MPLPVPEPPDVTVRKLALLTAVQEQFDAAVTGIDPVVAAALTLVVTEPAVTVHDAEVGEAEEESVFEHAAAAMAMAAAAAETSSRRRHFMGAYSSANPVRYRS